MEPWGPLCYASAINRGLLPEPTANHQIIVTMKFTISLFAISRPIGSNPKDHFFVSIREFLPKTAGRRGIISLRRERRKEQNIACFEY
jgi:hypothetical protein